MARGTNLKLTGEELAKLDVVSALPPEYPGWMEKFQNRDRMGTGSS